MEDITQIFNSYLHQHKSVDIAERAFKQSVADDPELRRLYREWCHEVGSTEKNGFVDYCDEYLDEQNQVWENLNDYNDE